MTFTTIPRKAETAADLNRLLASTVYLSRMVKNAHWNVVGPNFIGAHRLLDEVYDAAEEWGDTLAERARALGAAAAGSVEQIEDGNQIAWVDHGIASDESYIRTVAGNLAVLSRLYREPIGKINGGDPGTANILSDLANAADKFVFLLESHLGKAD